VAERQQRDIVGVIKRRTEYLEALKSYSEHLLSKKGLDMALVAMQQLSDQTFADALDHPALAKEFAKLLEDIAIAYDNVAELTPRERGSRGLAEGGES